MSPLTPHYDASQPILIGSGSGKTYFVDSTTPTDLTVTRTTTHFVSNTYFIRASGLVGICDSWIAEGSIQNLPESPLQKRQRIARQKMYASWKVYNDKTITVKEIKQICKPRHRLFTLAKRC